MSVVVVEREFPDGASAAVLHRAEKIASSCMGLYGVRPNFHILSADGSRVACIFSAPDAEALRSVERQSGLPPSRFIWTAHVFAAPGDIVTDQAPAPDPGRTFCIVERSFANPAAFEDIQEVEDRASDCLSLYRVRFIRSYFSRDRRRMLCVYGAPDAESVRAANRQAGLPFDAAWGASIVLPLR